MKPVGVKRSWGTNEGILGQAIVPQQDCIAQFLKKLKLYTESVVEKAH